MSRIKFMSIEIDNLTMTETVAAIDQLIHQRRCAYAVTPNVDVMVKLEKDEEFLRIYRQADLVLADGKPLLWIARWYGTPLKERVAGSDLLPRLCGLAAEKGYSLFFLGAGEGVAQKAAEKLTEKYPGLKIAGVFSPPFGFEEDKSQIQIAVETVRKARPDILVVALGSPKQEKLIFRYRESFGAAIPLGLGASLNFEAGIVKRAPVWMREVGLEWFYRMTQEPSRLIKRYLMDDLGILRLAWKYRYKNSVSKEGEN